MPVLSKLLDQLAPQDAALRVLTRHTPDLRTLYDAALQGRRRVVAAKGEEPLATVNPPAVQAFVLGGFRVVVHGQLVADRDWRRRSARQLFKALLSRPTRRMTRDEVTDLLWPDSDPEAASSNMRSTLHAMRGVLERAERTVGLGIVFGDRDSVWLRSDVELWVDADAFEGIVEGAHLAPEPLPQYEQASALYAGDYLPDDLYEDWASARRDALKRTWTELQFGIAHQAEARSDADSATRAQQGGLPQVAVGSAQINWWLSNLVQQHVRWGEDSIPEVVGNRAYWAHDFGLDACRQLGAALVEVDSEIVLTDDGRIDSLRTSLTPTGARALQSATR
jgi:two-component SAPR family response regulator